MEVVNVKVVYIRPKYANLKEWMKNPNNIYIGRRGIVFVDGIRFPPNDSPFANPFKITTSVTREDVINNYRIYIKKKVVDNLVNIEDLRDKTLGCWCHPEACHGDVLIELLANF